MKRFKTGLLALTTLILTSCQTTGGLGNLGTIIGGGANGEQGVLESVLGTLLGNAIPLNEQTLRGTWTYTSPDVRFESENALTQAGGMVVAQQTEAKLAEVYKSLGITPGACSFTFAENNQCAVTLGGRNISGTYTLNPNTHDISINAGFGLLKLNGKIYYSGKTLTVLFDAQKLLQIAQTVGSVTGQGNSTLGTLSTLAGQYKGMLLGMNLQK